MMQIKFLAKKDLNQAIDFAIKGMHFDWHIENRWLCRAYGRYFWYMELNKATQVIAVYQENTLAGVLLAEIYGEPKACYSPLKALYVKAFDWLERVFGQDDDDAYDQADKALLAQFKQHNTPDGEIGFLAANPDIQTKGIGTMLLNELANRAKGKQVYLHTNNVCTYQFYENRGFERVGEKVLDLKESDDEPLTCLLYAKTLWFWGRKPSEKF